MGGRLLRILELSTEGFVQRQFIAPLAEYLRKQGHEVRQLDGSTCAIRRHISVFDLSAMLGLLWRLRRWHIDVLHVQTAKAGAVGRMAAWLAGTPRVVYTMHDVPFHDGLPRWRQRLYLWIERLLAHTCHAITVDSPAVKNRILSRHMAPARKIHVIPVGVDTAHFDPSRPFPRARWSDLTIGTVARLVPEKGLLTLLDIMAMLHHQSLLPVRCLMVGEGPQRACLESALVRLHLTRVVTLVGEVQDVAPWLAQMDLFVLPTQREGLSVAVMEAMSMALPVVVSDLPAFQELVIHDKTGLLARPETWVSQIGSLLDSEAQRRRLGLAARAHVQQYYEQSACCRAYERVLIA